MRAFHAKASGWIPCCNTPEGPEYMPLTGREKNVENLFSVL